MQQAGLAYDALLKTYSPSQVVMLQYQWGIPLSNPDSRTRRDAYGKMIEAGRDGVPELLIDGKVVRLPGDAKDNYETIRRLLDKARRAKAEAQLKLSVRPQDNGYEVLAEVSGLKRRGGKLFLRFVLIEEEVRFVCENGRRLHRNIVRCCPGGVQGFALQGESLRQVVTVDRTGLAKWLKEYLANKAGKPPDGDWPLELRNMKVVAFIQDDASKKVLQAAQVDLSESK